jgi:hypothetical protein
MIWMVLMEPHSRYIPIVIRAIITKELDSKIIIVSVDVSAELVIALAY